MVKRFITGLVLVAVTVVGLGCGKKAVDEQEQMDTLKERAGAGAALSTKERELLQEESQNQAQPPAQQ